MGLLDDQVIQVACPNCRKQFKKPVRWFKVNRQACPAGCGVTFETQQFRREIDKIERQLSGMLGGLGKR